MPVANATDAALAPVTLRGRKRQSIVLAGASAKKRKISEQRPVTKNDAKAKTSNNQGEKRPRRWRSHPPTSYLERLDRAMSQRMFVLDRKRHMSPEAPAEEITLAGTTGNIYGITISAVPSCTCPDAAKKNQCKHIIYALTRILKAPGELRYQLSFLPSELASIFTAAPLPTDEVSEAEADTEHPSNRKAVFGDCPICFCEMADDDPKNIVWCKAACGNNVHKSCFSQWANQSKTTSGKVRCVYCRSEWDGVSGALGSNGWKGTPGELAALKANADIGEDGYANIASQLGIDDRRDYSSYHQPWRRNRWGGGGYGGRENTTEPT